MGKKKGKQKGPITYVGQPKKGPKIDQIIAQRGGLQGKIKPVSAVVPKGGFGPKNGQVGKIEGVVKNAWQLKKNGKVDPKMK